MKKPVIHNKFALVLKRDGKVMQKAYAENVVLNSMWTIFANASSWQMFNSFALGTGAGTPSATDTALFTPAFTYEDTSQISRSIGYPTSTLVMSATIPATASYTGALTEIGLQSSQTTYVRYYYLLTHAMLKDAEGNPITINKTDLDILEITATIYCTFSNSIDGFELVGAASNIFLDAFRVRTNRSAPFATNAQGGMLCTSCVPANNHSVGIELTTSCTYSAENKALQYTFGRVGTGVGNTNYYNGLLLTGWGYMRFPNSTFFPAYPITGMSVGTGDGSTTSFKSPLNLFVKDSEVIKVNGTTLTRNVDYTVEHNANADMMLTASAGNSATITQQALPYSDSVTAVRMFSVGSAQNVSLISVDTPLIIRLNNSDTTIGTKVNRVVLGSICLVGYTNYSYAGLKFIVSYSNDGTAWTEAGQLTVTATTVTNYGTLSFNAVEAAYWKVAVDITGIINTTVRNAAATRPFYQREAGATFLGYVGNNINFTVAPAADALIVMDASVDRPFKNSNFVIDMTASLSFTN